MITDEKLDQYSKLFTHPYVEKLLINSSKDDVRRFEAIRTIFMAYLDAGSGLFDVEYALMQVTEIQTHFERKDELDTYV